MFPATSAGSLLTLISGKADRIVVTKNPTPSLDGDCPGRAFVIDVVVRHQFIDEGEIPVANHLL